MDEKNKKTHPPYQKGQSIGPYKINEILRQEHLGDILLGQNMQSSASVFINVFRPPLVQELQQDFLAQSRTLMRLDHPHILKLRDAGLEQHYAFTISDYVPYLPLRRVFPQGNKQPLLKFLPYLKQLASALQYAHSHHVLHGDIRLENILVNTNNQVLLANFSIEALLQNQQRLNYQNTASIAYSAPERIQGKVTPASDVYSLGIVVYELLCGEVPFAKSYIQTAHQHLAVAPPSLREKVPTIPDPVEKIVMMALAKEPGRRFTSVQAFVYALEQALHPAPQRIASSGKIPIFTGIAGQAILTNEPGPPFASSGLPPKLTSLQAPGGGSTSQPMPVARDLRNAPPIPSSPPLPVEPAIKDSPPAQRRTDTPTMTRRVFALSLVGLATVGGGAGWYLLSHRLASSVLPVVTTNATPVAVRTIANNTNILIYTGHLAGVNALTWSPDGKQIASASNDTLVQVFDASTGQRILIYKGHTKEVAAVSWSPNGSFIASGGQDAMAQVWNASTGKQLLVYKRHQDRVNSLSWANNNQQLASGSDDKMVHMWRVSDGKLLFNFQGHTAGVLCVGWQPDNSSIASGSYDGTLRDWATIQHGDHFNAGDEIFNYGGHGNNNNVNALTWSPDGTLIASAGADQTVQLSTGVDGTQKPPAFTSHRSQKHLNPVLSVSWSPDGNFIASGDADGNVYVWQVANRKTIFTYQGHKGAVNTIAWSPDGKRIATGSSDTTVHVWQPHL